MTVYSGTFFISLLKVTDMVAWATQFTASENGKEKIAVKSETSSGPGKLLNMLTKTGLNIIPVQSSDCNFLTRITMSLIIMWGINY